MSADHGKKCRERSVREAEMDQAIKVWESGPSGQVFIGPSHTGKTESAWSQYLPTIERDFGEDDQKVARREEEEAAWDEHEFGPRIKFCDFCGNVGCGYCFGSH
jgi:hypothetical protein